MTVGIVGLGLIGGSFAKAYHAAGHRVLGCDTDASTLEFSMLSGVVEGPLTDENLSQCDLILIAVYPGAAIAYLKEHAAQIGSKPVVIDCCGTKRVVCAACFPLARQYGFTYLGGHPMAGTHNSGFKYATGTLFRNAPMVLVPEDRNDIELLSRVKALLAPAGFNRISVTAAEDHDEMIAFTSQLAHVVSNAYIKSPTAGRHKGFSAGSYKDMTGSRGWPRKCGRNCSLKTRTTLCRSWTSCWKSSRNTGTPWPGMIFPDWCSFWTRAGDARRRWTGIEKHPYRRLPGI